MQIILFLLYIVFCVLVSGYLEKIVKKETNADPDKDHFWTGIICVFAAVGIPGVIVGWINFMVKVAMWAFGIPV